MAKTKKTYADPFLLNELYSDYTSAQEERWLINTTIEPWYPLNVSTKGNVTITIPTRTTPDGTRYLLIRGQYIPLDYVVASTYLANPYDYTVVIHKDGDKSNCDVLNLTWDTDETHTAPSKPRHQVVTELLSAGICPIPGTEDYLIYKSSYDLPLSSSVYNPNTGMYMMKGQGEFINPMPKSETKEKQTLEWRYNYIMQRKNGPSNDTSMERSKENPDEYLIFKHSGADAVTYSLSAVKAELLVESLELNWIQNNPLEAMVDEYVRGSRMMQEKLYKFYREKQKGNTESNHNDSSEEKMDSEKEKKQNYNDSLSITTENIKENHNNSTETVSSGLTQREMMEKLRQSAIFKQSQTNSAPILTAGEAFGFSTSAQSEQTTSSKPVSLTSLANQDQYGQATVITTLKHQSEVIDLNHNNSFEPVYDTETGKSENYYNSFSPSTVQYTLNHNNSFVDEEVRAQSQSEIDQLLIDNKSKFYTDPKTRRFGKPPVDKDGNKMWTVPTMNKKVFPHAYYTDDIDNMMTDEEAQARGLAFAPPIPPEMRADILICDKIKLMKDNFTKESNGGAGDLSIIRENMKKFYEIPYPELQERGLRTMRRNKPVAVVLRDGTEKIFNSIGECATFCNIDKINITNCCRGKRLEYKGLRFRYLDPRDINEVFTKYLTEIDGKLSKNITEQLEKGELEMTPELEFILLQERKADAKKKANDARSAKMKVHYQECLRYKELEESGELYDENGNPVMEKPSMYGLFLESGGKRKPRRTKELIEADKAKEALEHPKRKRGRPKKNGKRSYHKTKKKVRVRIKEDDILKINIVDKQQ